MLYMQVNVSVVTDPLCDLSHILPVLPAGKHVGEGERLQTGVDQIRLLRLSLVFLCRTRTRALSDAYPRKTRSADLVLLLPLQYCSTVSIAHFLSASQRMRAEPVLSLS